MNIGIEITDDLYQRWLVDALEKYTKKKDIDGRTALHSAASEGSTRLEILLEKDPSLAYLTDNDGLNPLLLACTSGRFDAIRTMIKHCPDCTTVLSGSFVSTALHHVKFGSLREYHVLLELPEIMELKNEKDSLSRTPLHKAIQDGNFLLAKALLSIEYVDHSIQDGNDNTPLDLLKEAAEKSPDWADMCYRLGILQNICSGHVSGDRCTPCYNHICSGHRVPGGFDGDGNAALGKKAAFVVFMLSDAYAMSCSTVSLFSLIMVWNSMKPLQLTDLSIYVLYQSLYGTVVAFMSGTYAMVSQVIVVGRGCLRGMFFCSHPG